MKAVNPYLNFPGNTEEAFNFYKSVFGGEFLALTRFREFGAGVMEMAEADLDKIAHIALPLGAGCILMGTDVTESSPGTLTIGTNVYITLEPDTIDEAQGLFDALSNGGRIEMPMQRTEWAELYGICADKYGVQWMVNYTGSVQYAGSGTE
jgi:PhnB protein